jgi:predicted nucleic acid-binding protein
MSKKRPVMVPVGRGPSIVFQTCEAFWQYELQRLTRNIIFIDTGGIVAALDQADDRIRPLIDDRLERLVTSTYVIHETVRYLAKSGGIVGPRGLRNHDLAFYFLKEWLVERNVGVICVPDCVFRVVCDTFEEKRHIGCDLTDISSYVVVRGIEQRRIISIDKNDFWRLELDCLPN